MKRLGILNSIRLIGSIVITSFCFLIVVDLWFTVPETAGMALLYIPIMNGIGCTLLLTWIGFYRKSSVGILLIFIVVFLSSFLALEIFFEFTGAAGGVGYFAVQMAVALGANVTAVCRKQNFPLIEGFACVRLVDNETEDWTALDEQFDIVFDTVANKSFAQACKRMKKGATLITTMPNNGFLFYKPLSWFSGKKLCFIMIHSDRKDLQMMIDLYESGQLRVNVEHVFSLNEAAAAMDKSEFGRVRGKVVIKVH